MGELITADKRVANMKSMIAQAETRIVAVLPDFMMKQRERFMQILVDAALDPKIVGSEPLSVFAAVMKAAQCGLPLDGTHAALVPFKEKGTAKAQFIPMFQGLIVSAMRNGDVKSIWSSVVYDGDEFREIRGSEPRLIHEPSKGKNRSIDNALGVYACAKLQSGEVIFEYMDAGQVADIKASSKARDSGPWAVKSQEAEMWRKTAVRRLAKYLPKSPDFQRVLDADEEFEPITPREVEHEPVPAANGGPKRDLSDFVFGNGGENQQRTTADRVPSEERAETRIEEVPPIRWFHEIEITITDPPARWIDAKIQAKGALNGKSYREVSISKDPAVQSEVRRLLDEGAALQDRNGRTEAAYQRLAEACRLAHEAGPLAEHADFGS